MTDTLSRLLRGVAFALLALVGMTMALIFMFSTAIAIAVLYIVAKVRGKPFGVRTYWSQRRAAGAAPFQKPRPFAPPPYSAASRRNDVIDVEAREVP